jgi:hypothetical protein
VVEPFEFEFTEFRKLFEFEFRHEFFEQSVRVLKLQQFFEPVVCFEFEFQQFVCDVQLFEFFGDVEFEFAFEQFGQFEFEFEFFGDVEPEQSEFVQYEFSEFRKQFVVVVALMNVIVTRWNRHARRPRDERADALLIDGEIRGIVPGYHQERRVKMPDVNVVMNRNAVVDMALFGQEDRVEGLFRRLNEAMRRLKMPFESGKSCGRPPKGSGAHPGLHDVQRWLDSVKRAKKNKDEMIFIRNLYATCRGRVRPELLKELEG